MKYRKLDNNGDMMFGHPSIDFYQDTPEAVGQAVLTRLRLWKGEWFADTEDGTPYNEQVLGKQQIESASFAIRRRILETQGVLSIETFSFNRNETKRSLFVTATINTIYGETTISEVL
jgi:hypothetical protein